MRPSSLGGGRILRRTLSVRLSVRPVIVTERHVAPPTELQWHTCTFRHALRAAYRTAISAAQILVLFGTGTEMDVVIIVKPFLQSPPGKHICVVFKHNRQCKITINGGCQNWDFRPKSPQILATVRDGPCLLCDRNACFPLIFTCWCGCGLNLVLVLYL